MNPAHTCSAPKRRLLRLLVTAAALWLAPQAASAEPVEIGALDTDFARDVEVVGGLAYVADGPSGLRIIGGVQPVPSLPVWGWALLAVALIAAGASVHRRRTTHR